MCKEDCPIQKWYEGIEDQMHWRALHVHVQSFLHGAKMEVWAMLQIPEHRLCMSLKSRFKSTTRWVLYSCLPQTIKDIELTWEHYRNSNVYAQHIKTQKYPAANNLILSQSVLEIEVKNNYGYHACSVCSSGYAPILIFHHFIHNSKNIYPISGQLAIFATLCLFTALQ